MLPPGSLTSLHGGLPKEDTRKVTCKANGGPLQFRNFYAMTGQTKGRPLIRIDDRTTTIRRSRNGVHIPNADAVGACALLARPLRRAVVPPSRRRLVAVFAGFGRHDHVDTAADSRHEGTQLRQEAMRALQGMCGTFD